MFSANDGVAAVLKVGGSYLYDVLRSSLKKMGVQAVRSDFGRRGC